MGVSLYLIHSIKEHNIDILWRKVKVTQWGRYSLIGMDYPGKHFRIYKNI